MRDYLKNNDISIKSGTDVNSVMRDMMSVLLESTLDEELDEELGYSKYDYRNKETDNSRIPRLFQVLCKLKNLKQSQPPSQTRFGGFPLPISFSENLPENSKLW